jgi:hypothetical protein
MFLSLFFQPNTYFCYVILTKHLVFLDFNSFFFLISNMEYCVFFFYIHAYLKEILANCIYIEIN